VASGEGGGVGVREPEAGRGGGGGAEGGRPLLADQPRRGRGGDDVASSFCKWHVLPPSLGKRSL